MKLDSLPLLLRGRAVVFSPPDLIIYNVEGLLDLSIRYSKKQSSLDLDTLVTCILSCADKLRIVTARAALGGLLLRVRNKGRWTVDRSL